MKKIKQRKRKPKIQRPNISHEIIIQQELDLFLNQETYFEDILEEENSFDLLTEKEERELLKRYSETKDVSLRNKIVCHNLKLVMLIARKIFKVNQKFTLEEMINEGVIGLIKAINKFDCTSNLKLSTYAYNSIARAINRELDNKGDMIRVPVHFSVDRYKIKKAENKLATEIETEDVDIKILSKETGISVDKIKKYKKAMQEVISLNNKIKDDSSELLDVVADVEDISPESACMRKDLKEQLLKAVSTLTEKEAFVIINRFELNNQPALTMLEIGQKLNLTKERVRQIELKALFKLRHPSRSKLFKEYLK